MSWNPQKQKHTPKNLLVGEKVEAVVLEVDVENKRISLGLKQLMDNPWIGLEKKFKIGQQVDGVIRSVVDFGIFVDVGEEIDALIHVSDLSWTKKNINVAEEFKVGDKISAKTLIVDKENQKFCLGIKQLEEDPWKKIEERMPVGSQVEGEVIRVTDFGAFVEVETGIEGLIHISELSEERVEKATDVINKGDKVNAMIISIDKDAKKIALSMKSSSEDLKSVKQTDMKSATLADKFKGFLASTEE